MKSPAIARLRGLIEAELEQPILPEARRVADHALERHGAGTGAILFYGSCLRGATPEGVLDLYLIPSSYDDFHTNGLYRDLNRAIPPNIYFWQIAGGASTIRAKVAVVSAPRFAAECRFDSWNASTWARFCQPAALIHAPTPESAEHVRDAIVEATLTATRWAALLGPAAGSPRDFWTTLFRATYAAELRPERADRPDRVYEANAERYDELLRLGWEAQGIDSSPDGPGRVRASVTPAMRREARRAWRWRHGLGRTMNALRLAKGLLTFDEPIDYLTWKIERHSGKPVALTAWERRHPLLAAPMVFRRLRQDGSIR